MPVGSGDLLGVWSISIIVILSAVLAWWRPWEVSAFQGRYLMLKSALLLVEIRIALRVYRFRLTTSVKLVSLNLKLGYLVLKRHAFFIIHKFQRRAKTPNEKS
jgi:hypothetical protein